MNSPLDRSFYGGFWRRFAALVLDSLVIFLPVVLLAVLVDIFAPRLGESDWPINLVSMLASWLYFALTQSSPAQASPGQRALNLKVTDLMGNRISFARASGRYFASLLSGLTLFIGYLLNLFTARRQTLHDLIAGTVVYRSEVNLLAPADTPPPSGLKGWQVALVVIGCMIPVCGMLAAIAIPAYADYTTRARVDQGINGMAEYKAAIEKAAADGVSWADISLETLEGVDDLPAPPFEDLVVDGGMIQLTFGGSGLDSLDGEVLALTPAVSREGEVSWICGYSPPPPGFAAVQSDYGEYTSIERKYLPPNCR
jgi:uncharacterized RDD family membrane protein YckC/Tfp pilus assembly major pilin PilA